MQMVEAAAPRIKMEASVQKLIEPLQMTCPDCGPYACQIVGMWYPHPKIAFCLAGLKRSKDPSNTWILAVLDASTTVTSVVFRG